MNHVIHNGIVNFIWGIADDVLRDVIMRGKYRDVILPMTVIRRLDAVLEPSKENVLGMKKRLDTAKVANQHAALCQASGEAFYNLSPFPYATSRTAQSNSSSRPTSKPILTASRPTCRRSSTNSNSATRSPCGKMTAVVKLRASLTIRLLSKPT